MSGGGRLGFRSRHADDGGAAEESLYSRFMPKTGMSSCASMSGHLLAGAAVISTLAVAILALTGTLSPTVAGAVMLGSAGYTIAWGSFVAYKSARLKAQAKGEDFNFKDHMPWKAVAFLIAIHLPAITAGVLGVTGVASGALTGWIVLGPSLVATCLLSSVGGYVYKRMKDVEDAKAFVEPKAAAYRFATDPGLATFFSNPMGVQLKDNLLNGHKTNWATAQNAVMDFLRAIIITDPQFQAAVRTAGLDVSSLGQMDAKTLFNKLYTEPNHTITTARDAFLAKKEHASIKAYFEQLLVLEKAKLEVQTSSLAKFLGISIPGDDGAIPAPPPRGTHSRTEHKQQHGSF